MTLYLSSTRGPISPAKMHDEHLKNAMTKLERAAPHRRDIAGLAALKAEHSRRSGVIRL